MTTTELRWGSATHQGRVRDHNEDAVLAGPVIFAVADGMGGYEGGEVASALCVATLAAIPDDHTTPAAITAALDASNRAIIERGLAQGTPHMGSTVAGLALGESAIVVFNLGDSRVYRQRADAIEQLTEDDSVVGELIRAGQITEEAARSHPERNVITRALGVGPAIEPHVFEIAARADDVFVIASDGLFNEVDDSTMVSLLTAPGSEDHRARLLLDRALANGGRDNISIIVVTVVDRVAVDHLAEDTSPTEVAGDGPAEVRDPDDAPTEPLDVLDASTPSTPSGLDADAAGDTDPETGPDAGPMTDGSAVATEPRPAGMITGAPGLRPVVRSVERHHPMIDRVPSPRRTDE